MRLEALVLPPDELRASATATIGDTGRVEQTIDELLTLADRDGAARMSRASSSAEGRGFAAATSSLSMASRASTSPNQS